MALRAVGPNETPEDPFAVRARAKLERILALKPSVLLFGFETPKEFGWEAEPDSLAAAQGMVGCLLTVWGAGASSE
jgi:hypothetical protein